MKSIALAEDSYQSSLPQMSLYAININRNELPVLHSDISKSGHLLGTDIA